MRVSRCRAGTQPMNTMPMRMVTAPPMRMRTCAFALSAEIAPNTETVASTNTAVNPRMNSAAAATTAHWRFLPTRAPVSSKVTSPPTTPARYEMYPGTSGITHGEANETRPARAAASRPKMRGPAAAASASAAPSPVSEPVIGIYASCSFSRSSMTEMMSLSSMPRKKTAAGRCCLSSTMVVGTTEVGTPPSAPAVLNGGS